jgi:hypothetical protein
MFGMNPQAWLAEHHRQSACLAAAAPVRHLRATAEPAVATVPAQQVACC